MIKSSPDIKTNSNYFNILFNEIHQCSLEMEGNEINSSIEQLKFLFESIKFIDHLTEENQIQMKTFLNERIKIFFHSRHKYSKLIEFPLSNYDLQCYYLIRNLMKFNQFSLNSIEFQYFCQVEQYFDLTNIQFL